MDLATILGVVVVIGAVIYGMRGNIGPYISMPSMAITVGGMLGATLVAYPMDRLMKLMNVVMGTIKRPKVDLIEIVRQLVSFSEKARREGLLALEGDLENLGNPFMKRGLQLVVDGTDPELVKSMLETEMDLAGDQINADRAILDSMGYYAPAFGMIGTLVGLIGMLGSLNDPSTLGPNMSVALITTLYGAVLANGYFLPMAENLRDKGALEASAKSMILEGILSIQAGDNPRILEEKLKIFLPPKLRAQYEAVREEEKSPEGAPAGG